jgi:Protein of unknown function (DUF2922)
MAKTLELNFNGEFGAVKVSVRNPKDTLTPAEIKAAMDRMVVANIFTSANGSLVSTKNARLLDRITQDIELA